jgi:hypothetical protein
VDMVSLRKYWEWLIEGKCFVSGVIGISQCKVRRNRLIRLVRLRASALYRSNGCSSQPISGVYRDEHVVIGPASHAYAWVALVKEHCTAMALRESTTMPQRGSRKGGTCRAWFSEPAKKKFEGLIQSGLILTPSIVPMAFMEIQTGSFIRMIMWDRARNHTYA